MEKDVVAKVLFPWIKRWKYMNEDLCQFEVKMEVARYFALCIDGQPLYEVYKELQDARLHGVSIINTELFIDRILLLKLRYEWGEDVFHMVKEVI